MADIELVIKIPEENYKKFVEYEGFMCYAEQLIKKGTPLPKAHDSNLVDYAKDELKRIGMIDSGEPYNDWTTKAILDLIELFASQGHSGFTAPYVINAFSRLAMFKPISPLTGEDDEWNELVDGSFQNKRYPAVFKDKDGTAYNIDGKAFTDDGEVWYTCKDSKVDVTFTYIVPDKPEYVYRNKSYD